MSALCDYYCYYNYIYLYIYIMEINNGKININ